MRKSCDCHVTCPLLQDMRKGKFEEGEVSGCGQWEGHFITLGFQGNITNENNNGGR